MSSGSAPKSPKSPKSPRRYITKQQLDCNEQQPTIPMTASPKFPPVSPGRKTKQLQQQLSSPQQQQLDQQQHEINQTSGVQQQQPILKKQQQLDWSTPVSSRPREAVASPSARKKKISASSPSRSHSSNQQPGTPSLK